MDIGMHWTADNIAPMMIASKYQVVSISLMYSPRTPNHQRSNKPLLHPPWVVQLKARRRHHFIRLSS
jgi:hypothetical protein